MKIAIIGPTHKSFISDLLDPGYNYDKLPSGYNGAPFLGILIKELLYKGHEIIAITTSINFDHNSQNETFYGENFKWIVIPSRKHSFRRNGKKPGRILDFFRYERIGINNAILQEKPDFIHAHWAYEFAGAIKNSQIPHLITIHDNPYRVLKYMPNFYRLGRLFMSEWALSGVRYVSTVSDYMKGYARKRSQELRIIPNPIKEQIPRDKILEQINLKANDLDSVLKIIMVFNGWGKLKNGEKGIETFKLLKDYFPHAELHLYGSGTEKEGPANLCATKKEINGIVYHGIIGHDLLLSEISNSHLMIHPSLEESFGVVLIEAMICGVPVIGGINSGGVPWVINKNELLVDITNANEIYECAKKMLNNKKTYISNSLSCYDNVVNRFSAKIVVEEYIKYYNHIISNWE